MPNSYIPAKDADFLSWSANFSTRITATPTAFGLNSTLAAAYAALDAAFIAAYALAITPSTRTPVTVAQKDTARQAAVVYARSLANTVQAYPPITDLQLADLGLTVRSGVPTPVPTPVTAPILSLIRNEHLVVTIGFSDTATPLLKQKPYGVIGLQIWQKVLTPPPVTIADCNYVGTYGRWPASVPIPAAGIGHDVYHIGRWVTRRNQVGPASAILAITGT